MVECRAMMLRLLYFFVGGCVMMITPRAFAADPVADALFTSAKELMEQKRFGEACPKFEESYRLDPLLGVLLNLAYCLEQEGRVASSWTRWGEASEMAARANDERKGYADEHRALTEARLPRLTIVVTGAATDLTVIRDAHDVSRAIFGTPIPVDPGAYRVQVARADDILHEEAGTLAEAEQKTLSLDLDVIAKQAPIGKRRSAGATPPPPPPPRPEAGAASPAFLISGATIASAGGVAAILGGVFGGLALSKIDETNDTTLCTSSKFCTDEGLEVVSEAETFAHVSTGLLIGGGALLVTGVVLLIAAPLEEAPNQRAGLTHVAVAPLDGGLFISLSGALR